MSQTNKNTKIAIVQNATSSVQQVITGSLHNIESKVKLKKIQSPSIIIVGNVVGIQKKIQWFVPNL